MFSGPPFSLSSIISLFHCMRYLASLSMAPYSTIFCVLLSVALVSCYLLPESHSTRKPRKGDPKNGRTDLKKIQFRQQRSLSPQDDDECQEGNPLGSSYLGRVNVTASGMTCQVWSASQPHEHSHTDLGKHNHCRNPDGYHGGVWCLSLIHI